MEKTKTYREPACKIIILRPADNLLQTSSPDLESGDTFDWGDKDLWE